MEDDAFPLAPPSFPQIGMTLLALLMILCTMAGNAMVCLAVLLVRTLMQPPNFLLVSLAVADFFVGCVVMPLALVSLLSTEWPLGRLACKLWTTSDLALCTASIVNLCMISVDRYLAISRPLRYSAQRTTKRVLVYITIVWAISALVSLSSLVLPTLLNVEDDKGNACEVTQHLGYQIYATMISFYVPTLIMLIVYAKIWSAAKRLALQDRIIVADAFQLPKKVISDHAPVMDKRTSATSQGSEGKEERKLLHRPSAIFHSIKFHHGRNSSEQSQKNENKAQKTLGVMMGIYIICWLPFFLLALIKPISGEHLAVPEWLDTLCLWLGYSNSMLNPMIYCKYNKEFRVPFREMIFCRFSTLQNVMRQEEFTNKFGGSTRPIRRAESNGATNGTCEPLMVM